MAAGGKVCGRDKASTVAGLNCGMTKPGGKVGFSNSEQANQQHVGCGFSNIAGAKLGEQGPVDAGCGIKVEVVEGSAGRKVSEPEPAGSPPRVGRNHLDREQVLECLGQGQVLGLSLVEDAQQYLWGISKFPLG